MVVRQATPDDAPAIAAVHVRSWQAAYREIVPERVIAERTVEVRERQWREWLGLRTRVLVGIRGESLAGFCATSGTEVAALYVDPPAWRTGVGGALLARALDGLRAGGATQVTLWVFEANHRARGFYARHGFVADGGTEAEYEGAPEIRLRASLASSGVFSATTQEF